jgi:hypothetical protein
MGKLLIVTGLLLLVAGVLVTYGDKFPVKLGNLPGDLVFKGKNSVVYLPLATCLLLSVVLSLVMWVVNRFRG